MNRHPLLVWILLLITFVIVAPIVASIDPVRIHIEQRRQELPKQLGKAKKAKKQTDIVFFGNSLMQNMLPVKPDEISRILTEITAGSGETKRPVRVENLALDGRSTWDIENRASDILSLNPRVIVIQTEMIVGRVAKAPRDNSAFARLKERFHNWIRFAREPLLKPIVSGGQSRGRSVLDALSSPAQIDIHVLNDDGSKVAESDLERTRQVWTNQVISNSSPEFIACRKFFDKARKKGARIIVVEAPVSVTAAQFASEEYLRHRMEIVLPLLDGDQSRYLRYPQIMPDKYFFDFSHTNRKGSKVFFQWLAPYLAKELDREQ